MPAACTRAGFRATRVACHCRPSGGAARRRVTHYLTPRARVVQWALGSARAARVRRDVGARVVPPRRMPLALAPRALRALRQPRAPRFAPAPPQAGPVPQPTTGERRACASRACGMPCVGNCSHAQTQGGSGGLGHAPVLRAVPSAAPWHALWARVRDPTKKQQFCSFLPLVVTVMWRVRMGIWGARDGMRGRAPRVCVRSTGASSAIAARRGWLLHHQHHIRQIPLDNVYSGTR